MFGFRVIQQTKPLIDLFVMLGIFETRLSLATEINQGFAGS
jgi:hypothetical protein